MIALVENLDQYPAREGRAIVVASQAVGLVVFLAGICMIALVFSWTYRVFSSVDEQVARVKPAPVAALTTPGTKDAAKQAPAIASPRDTTIWQVSATLLLKFAGLFVLGWVASLVAARGASLATHRHWT